MLRRLSVENYALIDRLEMEFDPQLNIITGETGAGKSILLGALGLLLGNKNDGAAMKDATHNCVVEGTFELTGHGMEQFFEDNDIDFAAETVVRRMITSSGKSRAFVNDIPVQLSQLKEFGSQLIDIHSQHQNLILSSADFRTKAIDTIAGNSELLSKYGAAYSETIALRRRLAELCDASAAGRRDEEWLRHQTDELSAANLRNGEQAELEVELAMLENADNIGEALTLLRNSLDNDDTGVLAQLKNAENSMSHIAGNYLQAKEYAERLRSVLVELKDISSAIAADSERVDTDPERLQKVSSRLDILYSLQQKHRTPSEAELIAARDDYMQRLSAIIHSDEQIIQVEAELKAVEEKTLALAEDLHTSRLRAAPEFGEHILTTLSRLGMTDAVFRAEITKQPEIGRTGYDNIAFMFTANRNTTPQAVERIASGGEMSRVMLALKALLAQRMKLPTVIFDEIDAGVSGRIADAMGDIIRTLAKTMQVVDITHLPQVASKGNAHFVVYKRDSQTNVVRLTDEERTIEIAKMLSGSEITEAAIEQARILLSKNRSI